MTVLVRHYDEAALRRALGIFDTFRPEGNFRYEQGKLSYPVHHQFTGEGVDHWKYFQPSQDNLARWSSASLYRRTVWSRRVRAKAATYRALRKFYDCGEHGGTSLHMSVLMSPHVVTVTVAAPLTAYWLEARHVLTSADILYKSSLSSNVADLYSTVVVAANELMDGIERIEDRGIVLDSRSAPELHATFQDCVKELKVHFSALSSEDARGAQAWLNEMTLMARDTASSVKTVLEAGSRGRALEA